MIWISQFTPAIIGGLMIGAAAVIFLLTTGRIAGISGVLGTAFFDRNTDDSNLWRYLFLAGLVIALFLPLSAQQPEAATDNPFVLIIAGLLVGFGTQLGSGCTSGHGVCGISRFSTRSLSATITFMAAGAATVFLVRHII